MIKAISVLVAALAVSSPVAAATPATQDSAPKSKGPSETSTPSKTVVMPITTPNRSIYMNGVDISSSRNQDLRNVHVKIAENGDIYIAAPQYQVTEEETFLPLSTRVKNTMPEHRAPQAMNAQSATAKPAKPAADKATDKAAANLPDTPANATPPAPGAAIARDATESAKPEAAKGGEPAQAPASEPQDTQKP